jgi:hypothetical protein
MPVHAPTQAIFGVRPTEVRRPWPGAQDEKGKGQQEGVAGGPSGGGNIGDVVLSSSSFTLTYQQPVGDPQK